MQLECPHCGSRLVVSPGTHEIQQVREENQRLLGSDHVCQECESELGVYYY